jgi:hypothetical protein
MGAQQVEGRVAPNLIETDHPLEFAGRTRVVEEFQGAIKVPLGKLLAFGQWFCLVLERQSRQGRVDAGRVVVHHRVIIYGKALRARSSLHVLAHLVAQSSHGRQISQTGFGQRVKDSKQLTSPDATTQLDHLFKVGHGLGIAAQTDQRLGSVSEGFHELCPAYIEVARIPAHQGP